MRPEYTASRLIPYPVVLDSCVIFPMYLRDTLFRAAEIGLYDVYWSQEILEGATRNLVNTGRMKSERAARFEAALKEAFPNAMVEVPENLIQQMTNDPGDRHVAAAAVVAKAEVIVTSNLRDFPPESLNPWRITAMHPDVFLNRLYEVAPDLMANVVSKQVEDLKNPPLTVDELLVRLREEVPVFADRIQRYYQNIS
ncbi:PIN domain-containing protein [Microcoleus sp. D2_18a_D3]|uniref:PIN domain-containing protein n=1 Tax=Microcoleus sp. D2_18a_D3 TaxID=3055330 RepID=UPI002FD35663